MREPRCLAKSCQTRRNMQPRVIPLANVTTMAGAILPATRRDMMIFCRYCVASCSLRVTKLHKLRLVSSKKSSMSRPRLKCQQTLGCVWGKRRRQSPFCCMGQAQPCADDAKTKIEVWRYLDFSVSSSPNMMRFGIIIDQRFWGL